MSKNTSIRIPRAHDMDPHHDPLACRRCIAKAAADPEVARRLEAYKAWKENR